MKKLIYFIFILVMFGGMIVLQSCGESPIDSAGEIDKKPGPTNLEPNKFYDVGTNKPVKCSSPNEKLELWAGVGNNNAGVHVGYVEFTELNGNQLTVKYSFLNYGLYPWAVKDIHFHAADKQNQIPVNNAGNPVPGQFNYKQTFPSTFTQNSFTFTYTLPDDTDNDGYYVAAHASVCVYGEANGIENYLTDGIISGINVTHNYPNYYFKYQFTDNSAGFLKNFDLDGSGPLSAGVFNGSCIDVDNNIFPPTTICGKVYSSYENLPSDIIGDGKIEYPEHLPLINWIINNYQKGDNIAQYSYDVPLSNAKFPFIGNFASTGTNGTVSMGDIQCAIWSLMDNKVASQVWNDVGVWSPANPKGYTANNVWAIIHAALTTQGASTFRPVCNQKIAIILVPVNCETGVWNGMQFMIFYLPVPCESRCETTWADGKTGANFPRAKQWGTYFRWNVQCPTP